MLGGISVKAIRAMFSKSPTRVWARAFDPRCGVPKKVIALVDWYIPLKLGSVCDEIRAYPASVNDGLDTRNVWEVVWAYLLHYETPQTVADKDYRSCSFLLSALENFCFV
jgi:hypothetical protein